MVLSQFLLHRAALEYRGNKKGNDFVTVGKFFEYKFSKMLSDVCFDLSLLWHLHNWDIAFEIIKKVKISLNISSLFFILIKIITTCDHMIQLCCTLICTSVYNYVQL